MTREWRTVLETVELTSQSLSKGFVLPHRINTQVVAHVGSFRRGRWMIHKILVSYQILVKTK